MIYSVGRRCMPFVVNRMTIAQSNGRSAWSRKMHGKRSRMRTSCSMNWNRRRQPVPQAHAGCYISGFRNVNSDLLGKSDADFDGAVNDEVKRLEKMRDSLAGDSGTSA